MEGLVEMSVGERERWRLVQAIREGRLTQRAAPDRLGLSVRQVKRLCPAIRQRGAGGPVSRKRGRPINRDPPRYRRWFRLRSRVDCK